MSRLYQVRTKWEFFIKGMGIILSLIALIVPPLVYLALNISSQEASMQTEADINARLITEMINKNPDFWKYEQLRFHELLSKRPLTGEKLEYRQLIDTNGKIIAESKDTIPEPLITAKSDVYDAGQVVGKILVTRSLQNSLNQTFIISIFSAIFGLILLYLVYIPMRVLHSTFASLFDEKERAIVTLNSIGDAVITTDAKGNIQSLNPVAAEMIGWTPQEAIKLHISKVLNLVHSETREVITSPVEKCLQLGKIIDSKNHTLVCRKKDNQEFYIEDTAAPIRNDSGEVLGVVMVLYDVTENKRTEERLHELAYNDQLTGLPNRAQFQVQLEKAIAYSKRHNKSFALLYLDIDRFKIINDSLGHLAGDKLLLGIANRLVQCIRAEDTVARLGGDEFTLIIQELHASDNATKVAQQVNKALIPAFNLDGQEVFISASIGIVIYPNDGEVVEVLIKNADIAMYRAKDLGRNNYQFYTENLNKENMDRLSLESALRYAVERNELLLEYQPKLNLGNNQIVGAEALLRWESPTLGRVMPLKFIPLLEETGQIVTVGKWIISTAAQQAKKMLESGLPIRISVNLSARQFNDKNLAAMIAQILLQVNLPVEYFEVEITESLLLGESKKTQTILSELKQLGIKISLDDFGTGYSSLNYLKRYPIDILKIDKSFVDELAEKSQDIAIAEAIISMSHTLNMDVIAEGIETSEQLELLKKLNCDEIQGYWLSKPLPENKLADWVKNYKLEVEENN